SLASSHPGKHLSDAVIEAATQAAIQHGCEAILVGGEAERGRAEQFARAHAHVTSIAGGSTTLADTASTLRFADAVVTGDTVTMHLAAAVGTPVAAVWGCTRPTLGLEGYRPHAASVNILPEVSDPHRPCSKHGATCRHTRSQDADHPNRCSQRVNPFEVAGWLGRVLSRTAP
ncbi:MAG: glycosyltransferase family 9 protein, partial [Flavobacteriales bacterium]